MIAESRRSRRGPLGAFLLLCVCAALLATCNRRSEPPALIVLVTIDTLRADHLPLYGYPLPTAPFLAELAGRSVVFDNAHTAASHTAPAHASLLTSLYPFEHRALRNGEGLPDAVLTLPEMLRQRGYETGAFASVDFLQPIAARFAHADAAWRPGKATIDAAIAWLAQQPPDARVFLWVHLYDVHQWKTPDLHYRSFEDLLARETTLNDAQLRELLVGTQRLAPVVPYDDTGLDVGGRAVRYDARIRYVDAELRRLFAASESWRGQRAAMWIVTADHGEGLGAHQDLGHGRHLYEEQIHVPLLIHRSDMAAGELRSDALVHHIDLVPTIAEIAGLASPPSGAWRGLSLLPLLGDPQTRLPSRLLFSQRRPADEGRQARWLPGDVLALYDLDHKFIYRTRAENELYDLRADPHEERNLISEPAPVNDLLRAAIEPYAAAVANQEAAGPRPTIRPEHVEQLRALGYIDGKQE